MNRIARGFSHTVATGVARIDIHVNVRRGPHIYTYPRNPSGNISGKNSGNISGNISGKNSGNISGNVGSRHNIAHSHPFPNLRHFITITDHSGNISGNTGNNFGNNFGTIEVRPTIALQHRPGSHPALHHWRHRKKRNPGKNGNGARMLLRCTIPTYNPSGNIGKNSGNNFGNASGNISQVPDARDVPPSNPSNEFKIAAKTAKMRLAVIAALPHTAPYGILSLSNTCEHEGSAR